MSPGKKIICERILIGPTNDKKIALLLGFRKNKNTRTRGQKDRCPDWPRKCQMYINYSLDEIMGRLMRMSPQIDVQIASDVDTSGILSIPR